MKKYRRYIKDMWHALVILLLTMFLSLFLGEFAFLKGWEAIYRGLFRFARVAFLLCVPLYALPPICRGIGWITLKRGAVLMQAGAGERLRLRPLRHWLFRPFEGIGIGLFFAMKLLDILQITGGGRATAASLLPTGHFRPGRLLAATGITILVSLLLSTVWTLDDLGVRYYDRKREEIRMIGKYIGTLVPVIFGFYGVFRLFSEFETRQSFQYLFQIMLILYPPFAVFSVLHSHFVQERAASLTRKLSVTRRLLRDAEEGKEPEKSLLR